MKRRKFLSLSTSASVISMLNAHALLAHTGCVSQKPVAKNPLINSLRLLTAAPLSDMRKFYTETIGLPVLTDKPGELTVKTGLSTISFIKSEEKGSRPFYHFAFNIPENKIYKAFEWQKKRTPLVYPRPTMEGDPMKEVVNFNHWNAHSIFFLDPAGNLVEYIARHDLKNAVEGDFSVNDILYASEIGLIVNDVKSEGESIMKTFKIGEYRPASTGFWPIGDEKGLLLMIGPGIIWTSHPGQVNKTDMFKTSVIIDAKEKEVWKLSGYPYEIISKSS